MVKADKLVHLSNIENLKTRANCTSNNGRKAFRSAQTDRGFPFQTVQLFRARRLRLSEIFPDSDEAFAVCRLPFANCMKIADLNYFRFCPTCR